jgi:hypothetical protein
MQFAGRTYDYDEKAPLSAGDLIAIREMGADPDRWVAMADWVVDGGKAKLSTAQYSQAAEAVIQLAYLAAVRENHELRWRDFIWSLPIDDVKNWNVTVVEDEAEPVNRKARRTKPRPNGSGPAAA